MVKSSAHKNPSPAAARIADDVAPAWWGTGRPGVGPHRRWGSAIWCIPGPVCTLPRPTFRKAVPGGSTSPWPGGTASPPAFSEPQGSRSAGQAYRPSHTAFWECWIPPDAGERAPRFCLGLRSSVYGHRPFQPSPPAGQPPHPPAGPVQPPPENNTNTVY